MTQNDRDNLFILMVLYDRFKAWIDDPECSLTEKDKHKIKGINQYILDIFVQYRKAEGNNALLALNEESKNFKIAVIAKKEEIAGFDSFSPNIVKFALQNVMDKCCDCNNCENCDWKKCDWFTLHKFAGSKENDNGKKECPFKFTTKSLFEDIEWNN